MADPRASLLRQLADSLDRDAAGEVEPVALGVDDVPIDDEPGRPVVMLDADGRPVPVRAYQWGGKMRVFRDDAMRQCFSRDTPIYAESDAPALWRAFLRRATP